MKEQLGQDAKLSTANHYHIEFKHYKREH